MSMKSLQGRRTPVYSRNAEQHHMAADPWTKHTDLSHWPACRQLGNNIHALYVIATRTLSADTDNSLFLISLANQVGINAEN